MQLVIDGYNLLKKIKHSTHISDKDRQNFIRKLNHYGHQKKLSIILVFDAGPFNWPLRERVSPILEVVYSGTQESADDYIMRYIELHKNLDMLLITSDRELVTHARHNGILSMDSYEFSEFLTTHESPIRPQVSQGQKAHKIAQSNNKEFDLLMERLVVLNQKKDTEDYNTREKSKHTLSKAERRIAKKIKKL